MLWKKLSSFRQNFGFLPAVENINDYTFSQKLVFYSDRSLRYLRRPQLLGRTPPFIFGIGLSKTGTSSLSVALEQLGYPCSHWGYVQSVLRYEQGKLQVNPNKLLVQFSAYTDTPVARIFKLLDSAFPNSKFILTVREENSWFESYRRWIGPSGKGHLTPGFSEYLRHDLYGSNIPNRELNIAAFRDFNQSVIEYFRHRPEDLLVMNIVEGEGWESLCTFLNQPIPDLAFPKVNISKVN